MTHLCDCDVGPARPSGCASCWLRRTACFHGFPVNFAAVVAVSLGLRRLPDDASEQTRGVSDGLQASCRRCFQIVSPHLSPSFCRLSIGRRGYLVAKANCLAHKTNTRPRTLVMIYTSLVSTNKYGKIIEVPRFHIDT